MPDGGQFGMYVDWWNGGVRGAPAWATYHLQVLRQEIERRFPADRRHERGIAKVDGTPDPGRALSFRLLRNETGQACKRICSGTHPSCRTTAAASSPRPRS